MHKSSYENMKRFVDKYLNNYKSKNIKILDVGSQDINGSYKPLFNDPYWKYTGLDVVKGENVDVVIKDMYDWKEIESNAYDIVISGQVLEHIEFFWVTMCEITRVLKKDGICCIIVPSSGCEHKYPVDCWRFFPDGVKALARYAKLESLEVYNCWDGHVIDGEENVWKDTVLICRKSDKGLIRNASFRIKSFLSRIALKI